MLQEIAVCRNELPPDDPLKSDPDEALLFTLAEEFLERLHAGESPDREAILAAHPDLAEPLRRRLSLVELIWRSRK